MKSTTICCVLVSFALCSLQVYYVSEMYFQYPHSTVVKQDFSKAIRKSKTTPSMTLCLMTPPFPEEVECSGNSSYISTAEYLYDEFMNLAGDLQVFLGGHHQLSTTKIFVLGDKVC